MIKYFKNMKFFIFFLLAASAFCRDTSPIEIPNPEIEKIENACFPSAIVLKDVLDKHGIWSRIVQVIYKKPSDKTGETKGHVFVEFIYPKNSNTLWLYDNTGSWKVSYSIKDNPEAMVREIFEDNNKDFILVSTKYLFEN